MFFFQRFLETMKKTKQKKLFMIVIFKIVIEVEIYPSYNLQGQKFLKLFALNLATNCARQISFKC
jgi:hypothetical protein